MKKIFLFFLVLVVSLPSAGQNRTKKIIPNARLVSRTIEVGSPFHGLECLGGIEMEYIQGNTVSVTVDAPENVAGLVEAVCSDGILQVRFLSGYRLIGKPKTKVTVTAPSLGSVSVKGSGSLRLQALNTDALTVQVLGSGSVSGDRTVCSSIDAEVSGSGAVSLSGTIADADLRVTGSGSLMIGGLSAEQVKARVSGSGSIRLEGRAGRLEKEITGSGDIDISRLEMPVSAL